MSGAVYMTGKGDPPYRAAVNWVDFGTALHCAFGTLAALIERGKSGRGQIVEGALLATALSFTNATLIEQAVISANRVPTGNLGQTAAPADIYRTKDGWVLCQVTGHPLFIRWAKLMGEEDHWLNERVLPTTSSAATMARSSASGWRAGAPSAPRRKRSIRWAKR
jgi:crotonobetainyl-CoA:carnitine CoA-transferase CaiB-like acyl-CoA transferase